MMVALRNEPAVRLAHRHILPISGKDSLATAIVQMKRQPDESYEFFFNPTGMDLPETLEWLAKVEQRMHCTIERVGDDLPSIIREQGILPAHKARYCTRLAKIFPMEAWLHTSPAYVYYGIRADERRVGYQSMTGGNITPVYPLQEEGYTLPMVWSLLQEMDLLPPQFFWQSMYTLVAERLRAPLALLGLSLDTALREYFQPWETSLAFARRTRGDCHGFFSQRLSELVGLLEHHPDLFWEDAALEREVGAATFSLKQHWPLDRIAKEQERIKRNRCIAICKLILKRLKQQLQEPLFEDDLQEEPDMLAVVPCGLFCGK